MSTANSASPRAVPMCSTTTSRPARRSASCTFVLPERPGDFRTNTTPRQYPAGVCHLALSRAPDQHIHRHLRLYPLKWHESG